MKVVLADDHDIFRQSLSFLLGNRTQHDVVGDVASFDQLFEMVESLKPDCILIDYHMPGGKALDVAGELKASNPQLKIVVLTGSQSGALLKRISLSSVDGLVHKSDDANIIISSIDAVGELEGKVPCICSGAVKALIDSVDVDFTQREFSVLELLVEGVPPLKIAERLNISARTVEKHKQNMMSKTSLGNVVELIEFGHRILLVE